MQTKTKLLVVSILLALQAVHHAQAQEAKPQPADPKTKLEAFQAKSGAVIIRGSSKVGMIQGQNTSLVKIDCREFTDASSGKKEHGITVTVEVYAGDFTRMDRKSIAYIDYDEIDPLIKGIESLARIDKAPPKLAAFQADYKTKGDLIVSTFSVDEGGVGAAIQSDRADKATARLSLPDLEQFRKLIAKSKEMLDEIRK